MITMSLISSSTWRWLTNGIQSRRKDWLCLLSTGANNKTTIHNIPAELTTTRLTSQVTDNISYLTTSTTRMPKWSLTNVKCDTNISMKSIIDLHWQYSTQVPSTVSVALSGNIVDDSPHGLVVVQLRDMFHIQRFGGHFCWRLISFSPSIRHNLLHWCMSWFQSLALSVRAEAFQSPESDSCPPSMWPCWERETCRNSSSKREVRHLGQQFRAGLYLSNTLEQNWYQNCVRLSFRLCIGGCSWEGPVPPLVISFFSRKVLSTKVPRWYQIEAIDSFTLIFLIAIVAKLDNNINLNRRTLRSSSSSLMKTLCQLVQWLTKLN